MILTENLTITIFTCVSSYCFSAS